MKPLNERSDDDLLRMARQAQAMPDAPPNWIERAAQLMPVATAVRPADASRSGVADVLVAGWRLLGATLRFDSAWPRPGAPAMAVRSGARGEVRQLLFSVEGRDIDLRVARSGPGFSLSGQVLGPDEGGEVELQLEPKSPAAEADGLHRSTVDALGEFRFDGLHGGPCQLVLRLGQDAIHLPTFELSLTGP